MTVENAAGALEHVRLKALDINLDESHMLMHNRIQSLTRHLDVFVVSLVVDGPVQGAAGMSALSAQGSEIGLLNSRAKPYLLWNLYIIDEWWCPWSP